MLKIGQNFRLALVQLAITKNKNENLQTAVKLIGEAAKNGAKIISLPEVFNSPYGTEHFAKYAESIPGESTDILASQAKEHNVYIIGGSIPERDGEKLYNTCTVFDPQGNMVAKHRKVHLFDIDIPGKITVKESNVLSAGNKFTTFDTPFCKVGVGICFDIRFSEMAGIYANKGCSLLVYPGAFNMVTGPAHWSLLCRARAVDNLLYVASVSPARDESASYVAWGHSMMVNPWGEVMGELDHSQGILYGDIDTNYVEEIRKQIPVFTGKRKDLYNDEKI